MDTEITTARIRALNDAARWSLAGGVVHFTPGIAALHPREQTAILDRVRTFADFTPDNDPWREHDFGSFEHNHRTIFWKIDCYDLFLHYGSRDPSDPALTRRVLTILLAEEY